LPVLLQPHAPTESGGALSRPGRLLLAVATLVFVSLVFGVPARAANDGHLVSIDPADGSYLPTSPEKVRLVFSLPLTLNSRVIVNGPAGQVASSLPFISGNTMDTLLPADLPNGRYTVQYHGDFGGSGFSSGTVRFTIGPAPSPSTTPTHTRTPTPTTSTTTSPTGLVVSPTLTHGTKMPHGDKDWGPVLPTGTPAAVPVREDIGADSSSGWPLPPKLFLGVVAAVAVAFLIDRWWTKHRERAELRAASRQRQARP
jgi:methionine-rich copper-binding protein CopC